MSHGHDIFINSQARWFSAFLSIHGYTRVVYAFAMSPDDAKEAMVGAFGAVGIVTPSDGPLSWIKATTQPPPKDVDVLFCCVIDDDVTPPEIGRSTGRMNTENTYVMIVNDDDWCPCSHWFSIPPA